MYKLTNKPPVADDSVARIRHFVRDSDAKHQAIAKMAGLGRNTLREIEQPGWNPRLRTLRLLEDLIPGDFS